MQPEFINSSLIELLPLREGCLSQTLKKGNVQPRISCSLNVKIIISPLFLINVWQHCWLHNGQKRKDTWKGSWVDYVLDSCSHLVLSNHEFRVLFPLSPSSSHTKTRYGSCLQLEIELNMLHVVSNLIVHFIPLVLQLSFPVFSPSIRFPFFSRISPQRRWILSTPHTTCNMYNTYYTLCSTCIRHSSQVINYGTRCMIMIILMTKDPSWSNWKRREGKTVRIGKL